MASIHQYGIFSIYTISVHSCHQKYSPERNLSVHMFHRTLAFRLRGFWQPVTSSLKSQKYQLGHDLVELHIELGLEPNLGGSTVVVSKQTQRNLLLTVSSSKRMGNSCGCTEQMFYKYFLGPPHVEGAILMVSNYLSCFVTLWLIGLILWARTYHKKSYNEKDIRENGKSGKKS